MAEFGVDTPQRQAAFLAQVLHESGNFRFMAEIWGPTPAQQGYEGRADLGNNQPGDGFRFRGRGAIQLTGRKNYAAAGQTLDLDLLNNPDQASSMACAFRIAGWYWKGRGLNELADAGTQQAFDQITRRINGGLNGKPQRDANWERCKGVLLGVC